MAPSSKRCTQHPPAGPQLSSPTGQPRCSGYRRCGAASSSSWAHFAPIAPKTACVPVYQLPWIDPRSNRWEQTPAAQTASPVGYPSGPASQPRAAHFALISPVSAHAPVAADQ